MIVSGAQAIVECLLEQGVDTVFGYPGGTILPLYDALHESPICNILTAHEQGAAHAADGYARASGRVGVCLATGGPGATNLVTGLATAYMDSVPVVAITGQVPANLIGVDAFQEVDTTGITMSVTKHNFLVKDAAILPDVIRYAFRIAASGRPGPVLIDVPRDVQTKMIEMTRETPSTKPLEPLSVHSREQLKKAAQLIAKGEKPVLVSGGGVVGASVHKEVLTLAEKCGMPVVSTLMGLGGFPPEHPQFLGLTGMHGSRAANQAIYHADVILAVGSRFSDRVTGDRFKYAANKTIIHMDVDPAEVDKNVETRLGVIGDLRQMITGLTPLVEEKACTPWWQKLREWQETYKETYQEEQLNAPWMMHTVAALTADRPCIFVTDVGQHQMWAAQHLKIPTPRTWLSSGGLGTMGFGLPAAIGAQLAQPEKRVIHIAGDGGFKMTCAEFFTAASQKLPIISIVVDNGCLGMVRQWQQLFYNQRYSSTLAPVSMDYVLFGKAFGIQATVVTTPEEFKDAFSQALDSQQARLIVAKICQDDLVTPMIAPNATLDQYVKA